LIEAAGINDAYGDIDVIRDEQGFRKRADVAERVGAGSRKSVRPSSGAKTHGGNAEQVW
jgi:hypothetical protein